MLIFTSIVIAVLVIGTFSLVWELRWKGRSSASASAEETPSSEMPAGGMSLSERLGKGIAVLRANLLLRQHDSTLPNCFRSWSRQALATDVEVREWLDRLSDPAHTAFVEHVAEFSDEVGFQLTDLVNGRMDGLPNVVQSATQIIAHYCRANYQAALAQSDFDGYRAYAAYLQKPMSADSQRFAQQLYAHLVDRGMVAAPTADLLALTDQERLLQMQNAIRQSAERADEFLELLRTVVEEGQRTDADYTVEKIVQRAMGKFVKPAAAPPATEQATAQDPAKTTEAQDQDDEPIIVAA